MPVNLRARKRVARAVEDAVERVVIARRDGIELVIVTARAADAQAEHAFAHVVNQVLDGQMKLVVPRAEPPRDSEITGRDNLLEVLVVRLSRPVISLSRGGSA